jgi:hypothetical protein
MAVSERTLVRLAWSTWAASIALLATGIAMLLTVRYGFPGSSAYDYWREATIVPAVYATLGLVVATRRPRHPVGWLLIGIGLTGSIQLVAGQYGAWAGAADLPGRLHAMWTAASSRSYGSAWCCCCFSCSRPAGCHRRAGGQWPGRWWPGSV